jgi:elongation factor 1-gamma
LERLNGYLSTRTFLVGERLSFADVAVSLVLLPAYEALLDSATQKANVHLTRWITTCINQKNFVAVIGKSRLISG